MNDEYFEKLRKKYPVDVVELEIEKIEKLGYTVVPTESQCLIFKGNELIIDADFADNYHSNLVDAINAFWK